jgi:hypothetical protein
MIGSVPLFGRGSGRAGIAVAGIAAVDQGRGIERIAHRF